GVLASAHGRGPVLRHWSCAGAGRQVHTFHTGAQAKLATSTPDTAWPVDRLPPGSSQAVRSGLVSMSSVGPFRRVISGLLSLAFLAHTCRAHRRDFSANAQHPGS